MHDVVGAEEEWNHDEVDHVDLHLAAAIDEGRVLCNLSVSIGLGDLRSDGLLDVHGEGENRILELEGDVVDGIKRHTEGPVDDEGDALGRENLQGA